MRLRMFALIGVALFATLSLPNEVTAQQQPSPANGSALSVGGAGTTDFIPIWTNSTTLGNSGLFQVSPPSGNVGLGTTTPGAKLEVDLTTTTGNAIVGSTTGSPGVGVTGKATRFTASAAGVAGSGPFRGVIGTATATFSFGGPKYGVVGTANALGSSAGVLGQAPFNGVIGTATAEGGTGMFATGGGGSSTSVMGGPGVQAFGGSEIGASSTGGDGLDAQGGGGGLKGGTGVAAFGGAETSPNARGGDGIHATGGSSSGGEVPVGGDGVVATAGPGRGANGRAGFFNGDVEVHGNFTVDAGFTKNFKIDHPFDPANKYLYHAAIESSEVLNLYRGNVILDANGEAVVVLPHWLQAINKDFSYQLTPIGAPAHGLYIASEISNNQFKIAGGPPGTKVSWQVIGIRNDVGQRGHPFQAEVEKPESERGYYLLPEAYGAPPEKQTVWATHPQLMKEIKAMREKQAELPAAETATINQVK